MPSMASTFPGAAESDSVATHALAGTRWSAALMVVSRAGGREQSARLEIAPQASSRALAGKLEFTQPAQERPIVDRRDVSLARDPGKQLAVRNLDEALELGQLGLVKGVDGAVGEAAHDQVHLAHAAMPGAEQKFPAADIEPVA